MSMNKKQKTSHGGPPPPAGPRDKHPLSQVRANPRLYLQQIPNVLRKEPDYAAAALLGLSSCSLDIRPIKPNAPSKVGVLAEIGRKCPHVFQNNDGGSLVRQLLVESNAATLQLLFSEAPRLMDTIAWNVDLALMAVQKAPLCYLSLPPSLLNRCNHRDEQLLASSFRNRLISGDRDTIEYLLKGPSPMIRQVRWDTDLALRAVERTPKLYLHLPPSFLTKCSSEEKKRLASSLQRLVVSGDTSTMELLLKGPPEFMSQICWDMNLALRAIDKMPKLFLYLPSSFLTRCNHEEKRRLAFNFHKLVVAGDKETIDLLLRGSPPMITRLDWDMDLALRAVEKTPKLYLHLPSSFLTKCTTEENKRLASSLHKLIVAGDASTIHLLLRVSPPLMSKVNWDLDLALHAIVKTPELFFHLPLSFLTKCNSAEKTRLTDSFHKMVVSGNKAVLDLLLNRSPALISKIDWDMDLALQAVETTPKLYLYLPPSFLGKCNSTEKLQLASGFHKLLVDGDKEILQILLKGSPPLISKVAWDRDVALQAVRTTPTLYQHLPESLKTNDIQLGLAFLTSSTDDVNIAVTQVNSYCSNLFSDNTALKELFGQGGSELITTIIKRFKGKFDWDQDLAEMVRNRSPKSYCFVPAAFREDHMDAQRVMDALLPLRYDSDVIKATVESAMSAVPEFFTDRDAVHQLFLAVDSDYVVKQVVLSGTSKIPWDQELARLAAKRCHNGENSDENIADNEIEKIFEWKGECQHHLPLGMLLSYVVADAVVEWPDFLNKCCCHLEGDDSVLMEALQFVVPMLRNMQYLSPKVTKWSAALVRRFTKDLCESRETLQTLLKCIHVTESGDPLECLKGDDETSIALKRHIAEFLGAIGVGGTKRANLKRDALTLVYCLLTLPSEFPNEGLDTSSFYDYEGDSHGEDAFYCEPCCRTLAKLDKKYEGNAATMESDNEDSSEEEED